MALVLPTSLEIRARSRIDYATYPLPNPYVAAGDPLNGPLAEALAYVAVMTCRDPLTDVPDALAPLALSAVRMRVEQIVMGEDPDTIETAVDDDVQSFSAGSYSESRRARAGFLKDGMLNGWKALDRLLWLLMTAECRAAWTAEMTGESQPSFAVTEVDYAASDWAG